MDKSTVLYKRLLQYVLPYRLMFTVGIVGTMLYAGLDASFTYMLKPLMDTGFIAQNMHFIRWVPILTLVAFILRGVFSFFSTYCMTYVARSVVMVFRQQMFQHLLKLPSRFYDHYSSGKLLSKLLYDVEQVAQVSTSALTTLVQSSCISIGLFTVMLVISWRLTLIYLILVPIIATIVKTTNKRVRRVSHEVQHAMGEVTEIAEESIEGYRVVKTFGGENYETDKFVSASTKSRNRDIKVAMAKAINVSGVQVVAACGISFIIYLALMPNATTMLSAGGFVAMIGAMLAILKPLKNLSTVNSVIQRGLAGAQSVFEFLDEDLERDTGTQTITRAKGLIEYKHVNFAYESKLDRVLEDINFTIKPGETVAFVGRSGSGKTTLASILPRFYDVKEGEITLDGINIEALTLKNLRQQMALVTQSVTLFNDTVAHNIAYGSSTDATMAQIEKAAVAAHAMEFIENLPEGLNTLVGENGVLLSGGQRQRIAIARAILKDAPILILDEATSALDTESERLIQKALDEVMRSRTTLVIAHRLSTIEKADKIIVMDAGRMIESGSHQELIQRGSHYAKLHALQFTDIQDVKKSAELEEA